MSELLSVDPGMSTGLVRAQVEDDAPPKIRWKEQVEEGLAGLLEAEVEETFTPLDALACEAFHPRQMARSYKLDELEPLRIEGYIQYAAGFVPVRWRQPEQRHLFKETDTFSKSAAFLQWAGYWTTGSEVGCKDANDTNSAMMHLFGYLRDMKHRPTISLLLDYQRSITEEGTS